MTGLVDSFQRRINYMRISVTDRCDLRCIYCSDRDAAPITHEDVLRYEEITRIATAAARLGVSKLRLTGGEPLVRANLSELVRMLAAIEGIDEVSMTTNGTLLAGHVEELKAAGLKRVNVSLDSLKSRRFLEITGGDRLATVLEGIEAARKAGLEPVKINMVVLRGVNDDEVLDFATKTVEDGWHVRFIEHMPFVRPTEGGSVSVKEIIAQIEGSLGKLTPHTPSSGNGPASYFRLPSAKGTLGFIGAVTDCFCAECNRFRLTADGHLRPCLLEDDEIDLKSPLRRGASLEELEGLMLGAATMKREQHRLADNYVPGKRQMRQIGG
jgi:cyclic pyranopterin phosphate synthase